MAIATGACPGCGAPIEFSLGSSVSKVCEYCRSTVYRTDRGLQDLGKVAALANVPSLIAIGDEGTLAGRRMRVAGRVQLDQGQGEWDEWYVALDDGSTWAWVAYAQGQWFVTSRATVTRPLPPWDAVRVDDALDLGASGVFRIGEAREGRVVSSEGELPAHFPPNQPRRYIDAHGKAGRFATVDYGDGARPVELYVGARLDESALRVTALGPRSQTKVSLGTFRCPSCGGDLPKLAGDRAQRVGCRYCGAVTDLTSQQVVAQQDAARAAPPIPLGQRGRLGQHEFTCIAYLRRSAAVDGERYSWEEQLLFAPGLGFRWLVCDEGTWLFVEPVSVADVQPAGAGTVVLNGKTYRQRNASTARVDYVVGEVYWRCAVGEEVHVTDYASGDAVLSREVGDREVNYSASSPIPWPVLARAFGVEVSRGLGGGAAPAATLSRAGVVAVCLAMLFCVLVVAIANAMSDDDDGGGSGFVFGGSTIGGSSTFRGGK